MTNHPISPVFDNRSEILILGSFPSVKSREQMFFYGHPQNRFWKVLSHVLDKNVPESIMQKKSFLLENHIAVWDVIASCDITGSSDSSIKNVTANDITVILEAADIGCIFTNGKSAKRYYDKYIKEKSGREAICLPSTSPANARMKLDMLINEWQVIKKYILSD